MLFVGLLLLCSLGCRKPAEHPLPTPSPPLPSPTPETISDGVVIDTSSEVISVRSHGETIREFHNAAFGSSGVGRKHKRGDHITPLGRFRITAINRTSKFKLFLALGYPNQDYAEQGLHEGVVNQSQHDAIVAALAKGSAPPQDTPLGGDIGIHGIGRGSIEIHRSVNWTDGCIALDNEQITELVGFVNVGTEVLIR
ncbi:MAG: L,D-transpeptidase [Bdellovibrionota bacterium]